MHLRASALPVAMPLHTFLLCTNTFATQEDQAAAQLRRFACKAVCTILASVI